jgi:sodium-dependent phosphate cotransporter
MVRAVTVLALLFVFLVGVNGLGDGFKSLGSDILDSFFAATENPFVALMVGILATTLVQSSSVTTAMIVAFVAAPENPLPIANAVPMVMGANIGTTVTNTIVSLAHMRRPDEFRRAFSVATCHDFFNFVAVAVLLPLEMLTGYLRHAATILSSFLTGLGGMEYDSPIKGALKAALTPIKQLIATVFEPPKLEAVILIVVCALLIFGALMSLVKVLRNAVVLMGVGLVVTALVQSSSITTSLLVPLAGAGLLTVERAFPITIGANVGTTVTALLAALAAAGVNALAGVTIALVHLLFNISGTLLIYPIERIRSIPIAASKRLAGMAVRSRRWALIYVVVLFYGLPALFAIINRLFE